MHGFAVDEKGHKMSKSLGNIIVPKDIIGRYGCDAIRWWVAAHATQQTSIPVGDAILKASADCVQKIRAVLKYLVGCLPPATDAADSSSAIQMANIDYKSLPILDQYFLHSLAEFSDQITALYKSYQYNRVTATILHFVSNDLSAQYLHLIKDRLYCGTTDEHQRLQPVLLATFCVLNKVLWPIVPFTVEECWSYYGRQPFYKEIVSIPDEWRSTSYRDVIKECTEQRQEIHQMADGNTWTLDVAITCDMEMYRRLSHMQPDGLDQESNSELCEFLQVSSVTLIPCEESNNQYKRLRSIRGQLCERCRRFAVDIDGSLCERCIMVLNEKKEDAACKLM